MLFLLLVTLSASAQQALEVISLRYRTADQVLDTLRPLVEPGGTLTGQGTQLIVRVSAANLAEIRRALDAIDRPQRRLQISVRFDDAFAASRRDLEVSGSASNRGVTIQGSARDSQRSLGERVDYRVRAMDGGRARIVAGESRPGGFEVIPRVSGNMVSMQIVTPLTASAASGRLGEWFELGAVDARSVWVRVEALD